MAWLYKQPGSNNYWMGWRANGRQFRKSTKTTDKREAEQQLRAQEFLERAHHNGQLTEAIIESLTGKALSQVTFRNALDEWLKECEGSTSPGTLDRYRGAGEGLAEYLHATPAKPLLRDVTTEEVRGFLVAKRAKASAATANLNRKILAVFFLRAIRNGQLKDNPMVPIQHFKAGKDEASGRRGLTLVELTLIYQKAPDDFWRYMICGGFYTGLRLGDLVTLQWGSVDFDASVLRVKTGKTGKAVNVPIAKPFRAALLELRAKKSTVRPGDFVWPDRAALYEHQRARPFSNEFYDDILMPCGLAKRRTHQSTGKGRDAQRELAGVSFHSLRHSFVSFLKVTGATQATARELAGHSSDQISDLYTHMPEATLAEAVNKLPEFAQ